MQQKEAGSLSPSNRRAMARRGQDLVPSIRCLALLNPAEEEKEDEGGGEKEDEGGGRTEGQIFCV
jgi:hypothetical protein